MSERLSPIGFWSYARQDDEASQGRLSSLRAVLSAELQQQYGRDPIKIFQDVAAIPPGAEWEQKIREALNDSTFFIPLITPNFIQSQWCNEEFFIFREREIKINEMYPSLRGERRIFPIYYVNIDGVDAYDPKLIDELKRLQWLDFTRLRLKDHNQEAVREKISELAGSLRRLLHARAAPGAASGQTAPGGARTFTPTQRAAVDAVDHGAIEREADRGASGEKRKPPSRTPWLIGAGAAVIALAAGGAYVMMGHAGGSGAAQTVSFAKAARISAFPATVIDADTSDALWGDAADAGPAGFALASTAGAGAGETAAVYLLADADHPPVSWTGPAGSRGSAILVKDAQAWVGGDQSGQALVQALSIAGGAVTEGWRRTLGAGRVMGLASAGDRLLACVQTSGAGASSRVEILQTDGTPTATYAPAAAEGQIELHRVIGVGDGGGVAVGWITGASTSGAQPPQSLFAARFGADGHELWRRVIAEPGKLIRANAVAADADGLEVVGWRRDLTNGAFYQGVVETLDMNAGTVKGERIVRRSGSVLLRAVQPSAGGALFVSGVAFDNYLTDKGGGWLVAQIDKDGRIVDSDWNLTPDRHQIAEALAWKPGTGLLAFGFSAAGDRSSANPAAALYPAKGGQGS